MKDIYPSRFCFWLNRLKSKLFPTSFTFILRCLYGNILFTFWCLSSKEWWVWIKYEKKKFIITKGRWTLTLWDFVECDFVSWNGKNKCEKAKKMSLILLLQNFHNIFRLFDVLTNVTFTTTETMRDYYL